MKRQSITLEEKLKAIREVESIYALAKKWQRLTPGEKRPNWERIADAVLKRALNKPVIDPPRQIHLQSGALHHEQDANTARIIERTLKNGIVHPDVLHSYSSDIQATGTGRARPRRMRPVRDTPNIRHIVQHGSTDLHYPAGHLQGFGFVPREHQTALHVQLEHSTAQSQGVVPTKATASYT